MLYSHQESFPMLLSNRVVPKCVIDYAHTGILSRDPPVLEAKHKIFLSHNGAQKPFVKQLCLDIERNDRYPFFDQRQDCLSNGEHFPSLIFEAIKQCHVGVVVLSEDFFMSKWPMLELAAMVKFQNLDNPNLRILPVFLTLSRKDCCDERNIERWMSKWRELAQIDTRIDVQEWRRALKVFGRINNISCIDDGLDEVQCREEIVEAICNLVPPNTRRDDSYVQGKSRLCKIICDKINALQESPIYGVRVLGLHGVGGIGKTTACMTLCNYYYNEFRGKVCHVQLEDELRVETLQDIVTRLTDTTGALVKSFNIDECRDVLRNGVHKNRTFFVVDNVTDSTNNIQQAMFFLRVGYCPRSILIVTARSLDQLKGLRIDELSCMEMPELEEVEAQSLFLYHANLCVNEANDKIIKQYVKQCEFRKGDDCGYHYHPLALQVLGVHIGYNFNEGVMANVDEVATFNHLQRTKHPIFQI